MRLKLTILVMLFSTLLLAVGCSTETSESTAVPTESAAGGMTGMQMAGAETTDELAPLVKGFYAGDEIGFIHTEASDQQVAEMLTEMMGPQVVLVPTLAEAPPPLLANVYVFTNGVEGDGPLSFQPDVFDAVPGGDSYRPLRQVNLVEWEEGATPRELRSVAEIREAEANGELTITQPGVVVNMPILVWPGGSR